jgi:hypothetical protein
VALARVGWWDDSLVRAIDACDHPTRHLGCTLSYRDVEEVLAERGLNVSYETVRRWVLKFGPLRDR